MREIILYALESGKCPVKDFLDTLTGKQFEKVTFVFDLIETIDRVPKEYFKKLHGTKNLWEVRVQHGGNIFRFLGFFDDKNIVILDHAFIKKTQKTPKKEIALAEQRRQDYFWRKSKKE